MVGRSAFTLQAAIKPMAASANGIAGKVFSLLLRHWCTAFDFTHAMQKVYTQNNQCRSQRQRSDSSQRWREAALLIGQMTHHCRANEASQVADHVDKSGRCCC